MMPMSQTWRDALVCWEDWTARYGYPLVMTPLFESTELFERGVGESTEVVTKEMYTFLDRGGRSLTLRPENTAGVMRAYLNSGHQGPWKGAYSGPNFRYERPQAGRRRQFWQLGIEYIDVEAPAADVEVIEAGYRFLESVGVSGLSLVINSLGDPVCRPAYVELLRDYLRSKEADLSETSVELIDRNPMRALDSKVDAAVLSDPPRMVDNLCGACLEHYDGVKSLLSELGIPFAQDDTLVRGLDYYTRTTFEYVSLGLDAAQNAVGGGGRYDGLAESLGGRRTPGVGFALGLDRIVLSTPNKPSAHLDAYLVSETGPSDALRVASQLRQDGLAIDFDTEARSVKAQFRNARRLSASVILVWKGDGQAVDIQTAEERVEAPLQEVSNWFRSQS